MESLEPQARVRDSDNLNDRLFSLAYDELRRLASAVGRSGASPTLSPTALVHEAWIKMASSPGANFQDALHFKRVAARAMRQVLVDAARRKQTRKRGGDEAVFLVTFDEGLAWSSASPESSPESILALHQALDELARRNPRQAEVAVLRIFQEMEMAEIAAALQVSEATIHRDWKVVHAWLAAQLLPSKRKPEAAPS